MTALTSEQKAAGREHRAHWRELLDRLNEEFPVTTDSCSAHITWFRHDCNGRGSQALFLHQSYCPSPCGTFVFYYRYGRCARCGFSVRTEGDFDLAADCPMEKGAVLHASYELSAVRPDQGAAQASS